MPPVASVVDDEPEAIDTNAAGSRADAGDKPNEGADAKKPQSATDFVRQRREQIRAKSGATAAVTPKTDASADDKPPVDDKGKETPADAKPAAEGKDSFYSDDELAEIVESGKDLRNVDLKRVPPALRATLTKMQTAERKRNEKLTAKEREIDDRVKRLEQAATAAPSKNVDDDENDLPEAEYDAIFKTKKGRAKLQQALEEVYGVTPDDLKAVKEDRSVSQQQRVVNGAIFMAQKSHPEMKDDAFFDEVIDAIEADEDWKEAFESNRDNAKIMASVMKAAALDVKLKRSISDKKQVEKDKETIKRQKEAQNAKPGSVASQAGSSARPTKDMSTADFVRNRRAQIRGQA